MAKDSFGFGTDKITWDDPWGDNIYLPYKDGKKLTGKKASKYNEYIPYDNTFQGTLYQFHTKQDPDLSIVPDDELIELLNWYENIGSVTDEDKQEQIFALKKLKEESNRREL